ncbi:MAG TPA: tRNA (adenosine(37)-N6)-threonylcarbamoyltransferase complex ATPase subunit type 1 TsaE [Candidatus Hydrothermia bacterium]|nr:tRNA (adenosine(37)-N6)-threonylcarbamoyltransferase complex ATPase subunit type 1 TsaE [Candidatus Hydrothermia bacterium]
MNEGFSIESSSPRKTKNIGRKLASLIEPPFDILLKGELGAGKTEFVRGFLSYWGHKIVRSPSFTVVNSFETPKYTVHHIDLFRIRDTEEILVRGILDLLLENDSIRFIEWPELVQDFISPEKSMMLEIEILGTRRRALHFRCMDKKLLKDLKVLIHYEIE